MRPSRSSRARPGRAIYSASRTHALGYRVGDDRWWLRWACSDCGGVEVPLDARPGPFELEPLMSRLVTRRCPECETRRRRATLGVRGPTVWYDTWLEEWVLQLPDCHVLVPLEIGGFDAHEARVYRAAGDIAYSGDELDGGPPPA